MSYPFTQADKNKTQLPQLFHQPDQTVFCEIFSTYSLFKNSNGVILHIWQTHSRSLSLVWKILLSGHTQADRLTVTVWYG